MADALDAKTFKALFDELFDTLSRHPEIGPKLRAQKTPQRFVVTDLGLVLDVRDASDARAKKGEHLEWVWGGKAKWSPVVTMQMTSDLANRYFQGRENIPLAIARKKIVLETGDLPKVLDLLPIVAPFHKIWIAHLKKTGRERFVA